MRKIITILFSFLIAQSVYATEMVVATVNSQAITLQELQNRITLSKLLIQRDLSRSEFDIIKQQSLENLIDEEIKRQYAEEKGLKISANELNNAIAFIEKQRGLEKGQLMQRLPEDLKPSALDQIKDSILQQKIINEKILPTLMVSQYQVDSLLNNVIKQNETKEYNISQILIEKTENEQQDKKRIAKIYASLKEGTDFNDIAQIFSEDGANKVNGGNLGWFTLNELSLIIRKNIVSLNKGEYTKPIKSDRGWYIIKLNDFKHNQNLDLSEHYEYKIDTFSLENINKEKLAELKELVTKVNGYTDYKDFKKQAQEVFDITIKQANDYVKQEEIQLNIKDLVINTKPSNFTKFKIEDGKVTFAYIIDKQRRQSKQIEVLKKRISDNLQKSQAERQMRKLLQELREDAFVDIR